jgi:hypothetical protein
VSKCAPPPPLPNAGPDLERRTADDEPHSAPPQFPATTVVIGGNSRNVGKTSVVAGLILELKSLNWTAVKITQFGHGFCSHDGHRCTCAPSHHPFEISEERDRLGRADTCRFLAAGAARSLWLRVRSGQLGQAIPKLLHCLEGSANVIIESNGIRQFVAPSLFLMVLDSTQADFKPSARRALHQADALVFAGEKLCWESWPGLEVQSLLMKPVFRMDVGTGSGPDLRRFVLQKIAATSPAVHAQGESEGLEPAASG